MKHSENIKCENGVYKWMYEFNMLKNPLVLITVYKIFIFVFLIMLFVFGVFNIKEYGIGGAFVEELKELAIPMLIIFILVLVGYVILGFIYGWKYFVLFEMTEDYVCHIQMDKQFDKAKALGWLISTIGIATAKPGLVGAGILTGIRNSITTEFSKVKNVKSHKKFNTIKLDSLFNHNQIYVYDEDYEFVLNFIEKQIKK